MKIKRNEPFRYTLKTPVTGEFYLLKNDQRTPNGQMKIHNVSPNGLAISTSLKLPLQKSMKIVVEFSLIEGQEPLCIEGQLLHEKPVGPERLYGIRLNPSTTDRETIIAQVKQVAQLER
ncbi:PilZ domain-containing protein [Exiguobacterium acetylicum]|uniref:PilZ domain-containing protein n=1 Tax=Exiguobacterium acetylicum TaxID=41170 RepID=UPI0039776E5F